MKRPPTRTFLGLRELRVAKGFNQDDLARVAGVAQSVIVRLEKGKPASSDSVRRLEAVMAGKPYEPDPTPVDDLIQRMRTIRISECRRRLLTILRDDRTIFNAVDKLFR